MATTMWHGKDGVLALHAGICLTDDPDIAANYAVYLSGGTAVHEVEIDLSGLTVHEVDGYDRDQNQAPGDLGYDGDADVLVYDDEAINGRAHRTWRLMTPAALAAVRHVATIDTDTDERTEIGQERISARQAALRLGVSLTTIYRRARAGVLDAVKADGRWAVAL